MRVLYVAIIVTSMLLSHSGCHRLRALLPLQVEVMIHGTGAELLLFPDGTDARIQWKWRMRRDTICVRNAATGASIPRWPTSGSGYRVSVTSSDWTD